jgi:integrase
VFSGRAPRRGCFAALAHIADGVATIALSWEGPLKHRKYDDEDQDEGARVVPFGDDLAAILAAWRKLTGGGPDDHVVLVEGGDGTRRPLRERHDQLAEKTRAACRRAGLAELTFDSLRATYATIAADQGLPVGKLAALLGHADTKTTAICIRPEAQHAALDPRAVVGGTARARTPALAPSEKN